VQKCEFYLHQTAFLQKQNTASPAYAIEAGFSKYYALLKYSI